MENRILLSSSLELLGISIVENEINCIFSKEFDDILKVFIKDTSYKNIRVRHHFENNNVLGIEIFPLHYADGLGSSSIDNKELVESRYNCIKTIYYRWCTLKGLKPNPNEGWFKSKKFQGYLEKTNFITLNYVVMLAEDY